MKIRNLLKNRLLHQFAPLLAAGYSGSTIFFHYTMDGAFSQRLSFIARSPFRAWPAYLSF